MIRELLLGTPITSKGDTPSLDFVQLWQQSLRVVVPDYTIATLPDAASNPWVLVGVSDEVGGPTIAFSDGTDWRRMQDRAVVS